MRALSRVAVDHSEKQTNVLFHPDSTDCTVNLAINQFQVFPILMPDVMCNFRVRAFFLFAWLVICPSPTARKYRPTQSSMTGCELKITAPKMKSSNTNTQK